MSGKRHKTSNVLMGTAPMGHNVTLARSSPSPPIPSGVGSPGGGSDIETGGGYNSEDEYSHLGLQLTEQEWEEKDRRFEKMMKKKGMFNY